MSIITVVGRVILYKILVLLLVFKIFTVYIFPFVGEHTTNKLLHLGISYIVDFISNHSVDLVGLHNPPTVLGKK